MKPFVHLLFAIGTLASLSFGQITNLNQLFLNRPDLPIPIEEAKKRFVPYKYLSNADKNRVRTLGFSESSWNNPFVAEDAPAIEFEDFDSILEETPNLAQVIRDLEFTPRAWDCYVNHYYAYNWNDISRFLPRGDTILAQLEILGYDQRIWDTDGTIKELNNAFWSTLSPEKRRAASISMCYFDDLWNEESLEVYRMAIDGRALELPSYRYTPWNQLAARTKAFAINLGYNETTWNFPSGPGPVDEYASIELQSFYDNYEDRDGNPTQFNRWVSGIGFDVYNWDNCMHRFDSYFWSELEEWGMAPALSAIGWTKALWDRDQAYPLIYSMNWVDLTPTERTSLRILCYDQLRWDDVRLDAGFPTRSPTPSPTFPPTRAPTPGPSNAQTPAPTRRPTPSPIPDLTNSPTPAPTRRPTASPIPVPTQSPTQAPTPLPTNSPTPAPTRRPSQAPTPLPTPNPTASPTRAPTPMPTPSPTVAPTRSPSSSPTHSMSPSNFPSSSPTLRPTESASPTTTTPFPTTSPSLSPTRLPSSSPTFTPSSLPTENPTLSPSSSPTSAPSYSPTGAPTDSPTRSPTGPPSPSPTDGPTSPTTPGPTNSPTEQPTPGPTNFPTTTGPTQSPSPAPTRSPGQPTSSPAPTQSPTVRPSQPTTSQVPTPQVTTGPTPSPTPVTTVIVTKRITQSSSASGLPQTTPTVVTDTIVVAMNSLYNTDRRNLQSINDPGFSDFSNSVQSVGQSFDNGTLTNVYDHTVSFAVERGTTAILSEDAIFSEPFKSDDFISGYLTQLRQSDPAFTDTEPESFRIVVDDVPQGGTGVNSVRTIDEEPSGIGGGGIAGILIGSLVVIAGAGYIFYKRRKTSGTSSTNDRDINTFMTLEPQQDRLEKATSSHDDRESNDVLTVDYAPPSWGAVSRTSDDFPEISAFASSGINVQEEIIEIEAPGGPLGVILDSPNDGPPVVYKIRPDSAIGSLICLGDRLIAVDDIDVTEMNAVNVSRIMAKKSRQPSRKLTIIRETILGDC